MDLSKSPRAPYLVSYTNDRKNLPGKEKILPHSGAVKPGRRQFGI
jgi:hypothetical protein